MKRFNLLSKTYKMKENKLLTIVFIIALFGVVVWQCMDDIVDVITDNTHIIEAKALEKYK